MKYVALKLVIVNMLSCFPPLPRERAQQHSQPAAPRPPQEERGSVLQVHVPPPQRPTCISSYLSCVPPPHLKGSNVPSSASAWQDPQGSHPGLVSPGRYVFLREASCEPRAASCSEEQFKDRVETVPPQMHENRVLMVTSLHLQGFLHAGLTSLFS